MSDTKLTFLTDVEVDLDAGNGIESVALTDLDVLAAGDRIQLKTKSPLDGYLYAVLLDHNDDGVTVLDPPSDGSRAVSANEAVTVPDDKDFITIPVAGELRVVVASSPVPAGEWQALGGRDGDTTLPRNSDGAKGKTPVVQPPPAR